MAYSPSQRILSGDFNNIIGNSTVPGNALGPYTTEATATCVGGLYGVGHRSVGYGRTTPPLTNATVGGRITATQWNNLVTINNTIAAKTGTTITNYAPISAGDRIAFLANLQANISTLVNNRFVSPTRVFSAPKITVTRATNWGSGTSATINATVNAIFPSGDAARYFFNSGSELMLRVRHNSTLTLQDSNWNTFLATQVGDIYFGALGTRQVASSPGGTVTASTGYWLPLPASPTNMFQRTAGTGVYAGDLSIQITAGRFGGANLNGNGDNGNTIQFGVNLTDGYTGLGDNIAGGRTTFQVFDYVNTAGFQPVGTTSVTLVDGF